MLGNLSYTFQFQFLEQNHRASDPLCDRYTAQPLSACEQTPTRSPLIARARVELTSLPFQNLLIKFPPIESLLFLLFLPYWLVNLPFYTIFL